MKGDRISRTQLMALLWAGVMGPAAEFLPGLLLPWAEKSSWLAVALAAPLVLAGGWFLNRLGAEGGLARGFVATLGPWMGRGAILLYMVWAQVLLTQRLWACARRLLASGNRDGSMWFFLIAAAVVLAWMGSGKLGAFARAGQIFLTALLVASLVVLGLSLVQARPERILPLDWGDGLSWTRAIWDAAGVMGWGLFSAFLLGAVSDQGEKKGWHWLFWGLGGSLLLAAAQAVVLGNLGVGLAMRLENPFFALAKSVGVEGAFQRVESMISALWTFADLAMGGILVFAIRIMAEELVPKKKSSPIAFAAVGLAVLGGLILFPREEIRDWLDGEILAVGNLILGAVLPGLLCLLKKGSHTASKEGISCDQNKSQMEDVGE